MLTRRNLCSRRAVQLTKRAETNRRFNPTDASRALVRHTPQTYLRNNSTRLSSFSVLDKTPLWKVNMMRMSPFQTHQRQLRTYVKWSKRMGKLPKAQMEAMKSMLLAKMKDYEASMLESKTQPERHTSLPMCTETVVDKWLPAERLGHPFQKQFYKNIWDIIFRWGRSRVYAPYQIRKMFKQNKVPKEQWWNRNKMIEATKELYEEYHKKLAQNDLHGLSSIVSNRVMLELQKKFGNRRVLPNANYVWHAKDVEVKLVNMCIAQTPAPMLMTLAQGSFKITSKQQIKIVDKLTGKTLGGSDTWKEVTDYWVIEKIVDKQHAKHVILSTNLLADIKEEEEKEAASV